MVRRFACALLLLLVLSGCTAPDVVPTSEIIKDFFSSQQMLSDVSLTISDEYSDLLGGRISIKMPVGSRHPSDREMQQLYLPAAVSDVYPTESALIWVGDKEILVAQAFELFASSGDDFEQSVRQMLDNDVMYDDYMLKIVQSPLGNPVALVMEESWESQNAYNDFCLLNGIIESPDHYLVQVKISVFTNDVSRRTYFNDISRDILSSVVPGARPLDTAEKTAELIGLAPIEVTIPSGYMKCYGEEIREHYRYGASKRDWSFSQKHINSYSIIKMQPFKRMRSEIQLTTSREKPDRFLLSDETAQYQQDTLLGKSVEWQIINRSDVILSRVVIPLGFGNTLRIAVNANSKEDWQQLFDIVHTLEKK